MACFFGHKWDGCKCSKCGATRDEQHDWDLCKGICERCGKKQAEQHEWDGCKCSRCGKVRDEQHNWDGCKCRKCGKTRDEQHHWAGRRCNRCGKKIYVWDITDQSVLTDIAKNDKDSSDRVSAADRLEDREIAERVYAEILNNRSEHFATLEHAASKTSNRKILEEIVSAGRQDNEYRAAKKRLLELDVANNDKVAISESLAAEASMNNTAKVLSLLKNDVDINAAYYSNTPAFVWACFNGNMEMAVALMEAGADVNKAGAENRTPIMEAAQKGHGDIVELLIEHGADINATDQYGSSALRLAQRKGLSNIVQILSAHGGKYLGA